MGHDVFVSHSAKDKITADAVCAVLESQGIRCWVAPRDIVPGKDWGESIVEAIKGARVMVLVFSNHANNSPQIKREVERAVNKGIPVIPFRIEDVVPTASLEYFLSTPHWLDAFTPPLEKHLQHLTEVIRHIMEPEAAKAAAKIVSPSGKNVFPTQYGPPKSAPVKRGTAKFILPAVAAIILALAGLGIWYYAMYLPAENQRKVKQAQLEADQRQKEEAQKQLEAEKQHLANATGFASVKTVPAGATVSIDNGTGQESPALFKSLKLGKHAVTISMDGYEPFTGEVEVKENDVAGLDQTLVRSKGTIALNSTPAGVSYSLSGGAELKPRDDLTGVTPANIENLPTGDYSVAFQRDGWLAATQTIKVERNKTARVQQTYIPGTVEVTSDPSGAGILQDGRSLGITPLTLTNLPPGAFAVELQLTGYPSTNITGIVKAGKNINMQAHFARGNIQITSEPSGASVMQNGKSLGTTPLTLNDLPPGTLSFALQLAGYSATNAVATIKGGETVNLSARLHRPIEDFIGKWNFLHDGSQSVISEDGTECQIDWSQDYYRFEQSSSGGLNLSAAQINMATTLKSGHQTGSVVERDTTYPPGEIQTTTTLAGGGGLFAAAAGRSMQMNGTVSYTTKYLPEKNFVEVFTHSVFGVFASGSADGEQIFALDLTRTKLVCFEVPVNQKTAEAFAKITPRRINVINSVDEITDDLIARVIQSHLQPYGNGYTGDLTYAVKEGQ